MKASDFYFAPIKEDSDVAVFGFVSKEHYEERGCLESCNDMEDFLPAGFSNSCEACFEFWHPDYTWDSPNQPTTDELFKLGHQALLDAGFIYNPDLDEYLNAEID